MQLENWKKFYYEPIHVFTNRKDGLYEIWYTQDMTLLKENGEVVSHWNDILTFHYTTNSKSANQPAPPNNCYNSGLARPKAKNGSLLFCVGKL